MATKTNAEKLQTLQDKLDSGKPLTELQQKSFDDLTAQEGRREELQSKYDEGEELDEDELAELVDLGGEVELNEESKQKEPEAPVVEGAASKRTVRKGEMEASHRTNTQDSDRTPENRASQDKVYTTESKERWAPHEDLQDMLKEQRQINENK